MRIEAYTQVQQLYTATKPAKLQGKAHVSATDRIQISSIGKDIQIAKNAVAAAPDIREDVVAPIRAAVTNGTYQVSAESFAEKLMQKYEEIEGL